MIENCLRKWAIKVWFYLYKFEKILQFTFLSKIKAMTPGNRKWDRHKPCLLPAQSITFVHYCSALITRSNKSLRSSGNLASETDAVAKFSPSLD